MKKTLLLRASQVLLRQKAVLAILFLAVLMLFFDTNFYTAYNWLSMLRAAAVLEIVGFGVTVTVLCAGCDLSVGSTMCLSGVIAVMMINAGCPMPAAILCGILSGVVVGGTSFAGGVGGMLESFIGIFVLQMMTNCMDCLGIGAYIQQLLQGIVIVLILGFDCLAQMKKKSHM